MPTIVIGAIALCLGGVGTFIVMRFIVKSSYNNRLKEAEAEAEVLKKNKLIEVKEKYLNLKEEYEKQVAQRNQKIQQAEAKLQQREMQQNQLQSDFNRKNSEI
jgi:ribonuclease Y